MSSSSSPTRSSLSNLRLRTESMAMRLSRQPLSEAYALWDKGYLLASLRLFIFKAEAAPPFQLAPMLDAVGCILEQMGEDRDAAENFGYAADKYNTINQPVMARVLRAKALALSPSQTCKEDALAALDTVLRESDPNQTAHSLTNAKLQRQLAMAYLARSELRLELEQLDKAQDDALYATTIPHDRNFQSFLQLGHVHMARMEWRDALDAYQRASKQNPQSIVILDAAVDVLETLLNQRQADDDAEHDEETCDVPPNSPADTTTDPTAPPAVPTPPEHQPTTISTSSNGDESSFISLRISLLRDRDALHPSVEHAGRLAFALSEAGCDVEALEFLNQKLQQPPQDEMESHGATEHAQAELRRFKAVILADLNDMDEAKRELHKVLALCPGDESAMRLLDRIAEREKESEWNETEET